MKKSLLAALCSLAGTGCFFGGETDSITTPGTSPTQSIDTVPKTQNHAAKSKAIHPGAYVGDYAWIPSNTDTLQSLFNLKADGSYRFVYSTANDPRYDQTGAWAQRDSLLFFSQSREAGTNTPGYFTSYAATDDDTNAIAQVTDTSFLRREWTPLRQKPYWVPYVRRDARAIKPGVYSLLQTVADTGAKTLRTEARITLSGADFKYQYFQDTLESYQLVAQWSLAGTQLITENNIDRQYVDSTKSFSAWDTLSAVILSPIRSISDTAFQLWTSPTSVNPGSWDEYHIQR